MKHDQAYFINTNGIKDAFNRTCMFHGCVLKPDPVNFLPFSEEDAHEQCALFSENGYNLLYWIIPWNAVEPSEPDQYNEEYLASARRILKIIEEYPINILMVPDRKTASLPNWVYETFGVDAQKLTDDSLKQYAFITFKTLFFAGNCFTPDLYYENEPIQDYLQTHFTAAMKHSARRLKDCKAIIGFDTGNSAESGFIGKDIESDFELIKKASGFSDKKMKNGINLDGSSVFLEGNLCPWKTIGVWTDKNGEAILLHKDFFTKAAHHTLNFSSDFLEPFQSFFVEELTHKHEHYLFIDKDSIPLSDEISPYPMALCGNLLRLNDEFEPSPFLEMDWESTACESDERTPCTEIFIPKTWFPSNCTVDRFEGTGTISIEKERVLIRTLKAQKCFIRLIAQESNT